MSPAFSCAVLHSQYKDLSYVFTELWTAVMTILRQTSAPVHLNTLSCSSTSAASLTEILHILCLSSFSLFHPLHHPVLHLLHYITKKLQHVQKITWRYATEYQINALASGQVCSSITGFILLWVQGQGQKQKLPLEDINPCWHVVLGLEDKFQTLLCNVAHTIHLKLVIFLKFVIQTMKTIPYCVWMYTCRHARHRRCIIWKQFLIKSVCTMQPMHISQ